MVVRRAMDHRAVGLDRGDRPVVGVAAQTKGGPARPAAPRGLRVRVE